MQNTPPLFHNAFLGLWSLTWRAKTATRHIPIVLINILLLPALAGYMSWLLSDWQDLSESFSFFLIHVHFCLILPFLCLSHFGSMIREELQDDTMIFLITRPVSRARFFLLKYLTLLLWLEGLLLANGLVLWGVGIGLDIPDIGPMMSLYLPVQALGIAAFGSLAALLGLLTKKYIPLGILYGVVVEFGIYNLPTNLNNISIRRHLSEMLAQNATLSERLDVVAESGAALLALILLAGTALLLAAGAALFSLREYSHSEEMQKD